MNGTPDLWLIQSMQSISSTELCFLDPPLPIAPTAFVLPTYARRRAGVPIGVHQAEGAHWFKVVRSLHVEAM